MNESIEASSVDAAEGSDFVTDEEESGRFSSENERNKSLKIEGEEDRISALPDSVIQHIISLLPSTKQAIRTGILSKRWRNQWSRVPVLIFDSIGTDAEILSQFIDRTLVLHDCSKLKKFQYDIRYCYHPWSDPQLTSKIRFAIRKHVEELVLHMYPNRTDDGEEKLQYKLPEFLGRNDALVKLDLFMCHFHHRWRPYWPSLRELKLECSLRLTAIENAVAGCPSLELLELTGPHFENCVIASKSLKRLVIMDCRIAAGSDPVSISCPNLEELCIKISEIWKGGFSFVPYQTIEKVLSCSPVLQSLELRDIASPCSDRFVIASESLKKLVLGKFYNTADFEIWCPRLEEANLFDFKPASNSSRRLAMKMLLQIQHAKLLEIGCWFIKILSALEVKGQSALTLQCKYLTLDGFRFDKFLPGFMFAIRSSKNLEHLTMKFSYNEMLKVKKFYGQLPLMEPAFLNKCIKKADMHKATVFNCLVSNLKTVKIVVLPDPEKDDMHRLVFSFIEFVLQNSQVLERIVIEKAIGGTLFTVGVSKRLLGFQRCYPHVSVELCYI